MKLSKKQKLSLLIILLIILSVFFYIQRTNLFLLITNPSNPYSQINIYKKANLIFDTIRETQNKIISNFYSPSEKLPSYKIKIPQKALSDLNANLPESGRIYQDSKITLPDNSTQDIKLKFRGTHYWHWEFPKKSWRIKLDKKIENEKYFNLLNPRHKSQILYTLGYKLGEQAGLLSPRTQFVTLHINDKYQGVYEKIEQVNQDFLINHKQKPGDIYYGEPAPGTTPQVKRSRYKGVFEHSELWELKPSPKNKTNDISRLEEFLKITQLENPEEFKDQISKIFDIDKLLRYIAIQDIIKTNHIDSNHNFKMYLDPGTNKFEPIVWDLYGWLPTKIELHFSTINNYFFHKILLIPEYYEIKNQYVWDFIHSFASQENISKFVDEHYELLNHELYFDPLKDYIDSIVLDPYVRRPLSFKEWEKALDLVKTWFSFREDYITRKLNNTSITIFTSQDSEKLIFEIEGYSPVQIEGTDIKLYPDLKRIEEKVKLKDKYNTLLVPTPKSYELYIDTPLSDLKFKNTITQNYLIPVIQEL